MLKFRISKIRLKTIMAKSSWKILAFTSYIRLSLHVLSYIVHCTNKQRHRPRHTHTNESILFRSIFVCRTHVILNLLQHSFICIKGTLMQIWKSSCMFLFIWKYCPESFAFLILRIFELYTRKVCEMFVYKHTETIEYFKK